MKPDAKPACAIGLCLLAMMGSTQAQSQTKIDVPNEARWQHARSGVILPISLGNIPRTSITDYSQSELNVAAHYRSDTAEVTIYIYRPFWPHVGAWFERSERMLFAEKSAALPIAGASPPRAFARPGKQIASGLRRLYTLSQGASKTTALAIIPYGGWLLKVRYTSGEPELVKADALLDGVLKAIRIPDAAAEGDVVEPIVPCSQPTKWKKAKILREDMVSAMFSGTTFVAMMNEGGGTPPRPAELCKEPASSDYFTVYRNMSKPKNYWMLAMDAGLTAQLLEVKPLQGKFKQIWSIVSMDARHDLSPSFLGTPSPDQWLSVIMSGTSRATVVIDPDAPPGTKPETVLRVDADSIPG